MTVRRGLPPKKPLIPPRPARDAAALLQYEQLKEELHSWDQRRMSNANRELVRIKAEVAARLREVEGAAQEEAIAK